MTKLEEMQAAGIPVIPEMSDETLGQWSFGAMTQEQQEQADWILMTDEQKWDAIRAERDFLLKETDFTLLPDAPPYTQEGVDEIAVYRQALRDLPQLFENPDMVVFPTKPSWL